MQPVALIGRRVFVWPMSAVQHIDWDVVNASRNKTKAGPFIRTTALHCIATAVPSARPFYLFIVCANWTQYDNYLYNNRPDVAAKRHAGYRKFNSDPVWRKERNRRGVEYFKKNMAKVYAYRKSRPDIYSAEAGRAYIRDWQRKKRETDPQYLLGNRLRSRMWHGIRGQGGKKRNKTESLIGCTIKQFREHIESNFLPGMTWDNATLWHLDHKVPCAAFDLRNESEQRKAFHFMNVQPLWKADNLSKSDKRMKQTALPL